MLPEHRVLYLYRRLTAVAAQVEYITGGATNQSGTATTFSATGPTVPAGGVQIFDITINSDTVTASLDGGGWTEIVTSGSDAAPNRLRRYVRSGPITGGTVNVTLSSGVVAIGFCYGMTGVVDNSTTTTSGFVDNPAAPTLTTVALSTVVDAIATGTYPRYVNTAPAGSTIAYNHWRYTAGGGCSLAVVYENQGAGTASIGSFLMWDPDANAAAQEQYRQNATAFKPA